MRRCKSLSPRLSLPHRCLSAHRRTIGGADWRFVGVKRCSSNWRVLSLRGGGGFCIVWPVISTPCLPVCKFTILTIEDPNTIDSELVDAPPLIPLVPASLHKPKSEKRLSKLLSISALDVWGTVRATGHKTPGESSVVLQIVVMVQLTSRRILRD